MNASPLAWIERPDRLRIDVTGPDRAKFLNNLATNDVRRLAAGFGCEAFVTSPQGKTIAFVTILATEDRLILRTESAAKEGLIAHLGKYGIFDDVVIVDVTESSFELVVAGPDAADRLGIGEDLPDLGHRSRSIAGRDVLVVRDDPTGRGGLTLLGDREGFDQLSGFLGEMGSELDPAEFESMRIEAGTPAFGKDVTLENLPQEIGRDSKAINFVKGCYLGQETVARIDALGHVNKLLRGLQIEGDAIPPPGSILESDGKAVGKVTSSAYSKGFEKPVALGMVRVSAGSGLEVVFDGKRSRAEVVDLPMIPD